MIGPTTRCPEGIGLVFVDLDGTLLINGTRVTDRSLDTLMLVRERGCMVCVSTGREIGIVPEWLRTPGAVDYLLCANGAAVYDTIHGVLLERSMPRDQVLAAMDALTPLHPGWNAFIDGHAYFEWRGLSYMLSGRREPLSPQDMRKSLHSGFAVTARKGARNIRRGVGYLKRIVLQRDTQSQVRRVRPFVEAADAGVHKLGCSLPSAEGCERAIEVLAHLGGFEVARMGRTELEITAAGATKGTAAQWLMDHIKVPSACCVAFGDSENDAPLADVCGTFVAMENGDARIKELADEVCEANYDDGVARWLERAMNEADGARYVQDK